MDTSPLQYKLSGVHRLAGYKNAFDQDNGPTDPSVINDFVNLFCEYQLADNNYMNIHQEALLHASNEKWFTGLGTDEVLRLITYIIWTDKFLEGFMNAKVKDKTLYFLLTRLETIREELVLSAARN